MGDSVVLNWIKSRSFSAIQYTIRIFVSESELLRVKVLFTLARMLRYAQQITRHFFMSRVADER